MVHLRSKHRLKQDLDNYVYLLSLDGPNTDLLYSMLEVGELPNMKEHFFDRMLVGTKTGLCGLPSVTTFSHEMYTTGQFSRHPGLRWWNRKKQGFVDYGKQLAIKRLEEDACKDQTTIHQILGDSATVLEFTNKGARRKYRPWVRTGKWSLLYQAGHWLSNLITDSKKCPTDIITNYSLAIDRVTTKRAVKLYKNKKKHKVPRLLVDWKYGMDEVAHSQGVENGILADSYRAIDRYIGRTMDAIDSTGLYDKFLLVLLADHNNLPVEKGNNIHLDNLIRKFGYDVKSGKRDLRYEVRSTYFGDATGYIYYMGRKKDPDKRATYADLEKLVDGFAEEESTAIVMARGDEKNENGEHEIILALGSSRARLQTRVVDGTKEYRLTGDNVLGYREESFAAISDWHTAEDNLRFTSFEDIPWVFPSIEKVFSDKRSPDVMTITKDGYDYSGGNADGTWIQKIIGHTCLKTADGLASKAGRSVPLIFSGDPLQMPGFDHNGTVFVPTGTLTDVPATILDIILEDKSELDRYHFDGMSLLERDYSGFAD